MGDEKPWRLVYYVGKSGKCPVEDFLDRLSHADAHAYVALIELYLPAIKEQGPSVGEPIFKYLTNLNLPGLGEIRWRANRATYRIYVGIESDRRIVFYLGVKKKRFEFSRKDQARVRQRYNDYHSAEYSAVARRRPR